MYRLINKGFEALNRKSPVIVVTPASQSIGNCAEEIFFGLLKAKREGKKVLLLFLQLQLFWKLFVPLGNKEVFLLEHECIVSNRSWYGRLSSWILTAVFVFIRASFLIWKSVKLRWLLRKLWPGIPLAVPFSLNYLLPSIGRSSLWVPDKVNSFSWSSVEPLNWKNQFDDYQPPRLMKDKLAKATEVRLKMEIPLTDWFACLHVRDGGFLGDVGSPRNATIENYVEGIQVITDAGGWVVRIGDPGMVPLKPMYHVIDYAHSPYKSALMDMYLISHCRYFIGNNSGPSDLATLFSKQMILINSNEWAVAYPLKKGDVSILKHIFCPSRKRFLSISEILDEPFGVQTFGSGTGLFGVGSMQRVENTPDEIRDVIEEVLTRPEKYHDSELQAMFIQRRQKQIHRWIDNGPYLGTPSTPEIVQQYRIASRADSCGATLGKKYLDENWFEDSMNHTSELPTNKSIQAEQHA